MAHSDEHGIPHLWIVGPKGWLCVVGGHAWADTTTPFGECVTALPWACEAIERAEEVSGMSIVAVAEGLGVVL